ncbi:MAG: hypothetical protein M9894_17090 [Planctomycetes bacterium]|nr:hypothetical protein [Planctomycetota bacterium]
MRQRTKRAKTAQVHVRLDEELQEALERAAEQDERCLAEYVRRVLRQHVAGLAKAAGASS